MAFNQKEEKVRVNARIPKNLYDWVCSKYDNTSQAINEGLECLKESTAARSHTKHTGDIQDDIQEPHDVIHEHKVKVDELSKELKGALELLKAVEKNYETQQAWIENMKAQIQALYDQLNTKDEQLHVKDDQIEKLNENMHKQAVHIQTLIQENSKLNMKLLPEITGNNKPWWRFW